MGVKAYSIIVTASEILDPIDEMTSLTEMT